jgi:elongation factor P
VIKGQTASSSFKPAILENNLKIMVPPFIKPKDKIVVSTTDFIYIEKAKTAE